MSTSSPKRVVPADRTEWQHVRVKPGVEAEAGRTAADPHDWAEREEEREEPRRAQGEHPFSVREAAVADPRTPASPARERVPAGAGTQGVRRRRR